jgi:hypothetical protein
MHDALTTYFDGEKNAGLLIAGIGGRAARRELPG